MPIGENFGQNFIPMSRRLGKTTTPFQPEDDRPDIQAILARINAGAARYDPGSAAHTPVPVGTIMSPAGTGATIGSRSWNNRRGYRRLRNRIRITVRGPSRIIYRTRSGRREAGSINGKYCNAHALLAKRRSNRESAARRRGVGKVAPAAL